MFKDENPVPLHRPIIGDLEIHCMTDTLKSTFVSSVGQQITEFENSIADFVNVEHAIAVTNGTSALHLGLIVAGVSKGDEVITQALTFVATANAVSYCGAQPVFVDVDGETLGMCPESLERWLRHHVIIENNVPYNKTTRNKIAACLPMHTFGFPCSIEKINEICHSFNIPVVEDAAEALGSYYNGQHVGTKSLLATLSFNGNKIITTGGGGMILTNNEQIARKLRHLSTTAKHDHPYQYFHDEVGYNYRLPNINAALGVAQFQRLPSILKRKKNLYHEYEEFCSIHQLKLSKPPENTTPNYWINNIICDSHAEQLQVLEQLNDHGILARPPWSLMVDLPMYENCQYDELLTARHISSHFIGLPSSSPMDNQIKC